MAARSIGSVTLTLGLVTIPAKLYTAHAKREVSFNRFERSTGARVKQPTVSSIDGRVLEHADLVSGYEYTPDKFVVFAPDELKALELQGDPSRIRVLGVVPASTFDASHVVKTIFSGPNKGGERAYHLLARLLQKRSQVAVGQRGGRTRDELVIVRPQAGKRRLSLVLHECLYLDEVRAETLEEVAPPEIALSPLELELGDKLLDELARPTFAAVLGTLVDGGAARVKTAVDRKVEGHEIVVPPPRDDRSPLDLLEQLRASVPSRGPRKAGAPASQARRRRAS